MLKTLRFELTDFEFLLEEIIQKEAILTEKIEDKVYAN